MICKNCGAEAGDKKHCPYCNQLANTREEVEDKAHRSLPWPKFFSVLCILVVAIFAVLIGIGIVKGIMDQPWGSQNGWNNEFVRDIFRTRNNEFTVRDESGKVLMRGGIKNATAVKREWKDTVTKEPMVSYTIEVSFTKEGGERFEELVAQYAETGEVLSLYVNDEYLCGKKFLVSSIHIPIKLPLSDEVFTYPDMETAEKYADALRHCKKELVTE